MFQTLRSRLIFITFLVLSAVYGIWPRERIQRHVPERIMTQSSVLTIGTFDGVHRGHQAVLEEIAGRARRSGRRSVLVTFEPHPLEIVNPAAAPPLLTLAEERREILAQSELDLVVFLPFTRTLSQYTPRQFIELLRERYGMEELVIGHPSIFFAEREGGIWLIRPVNPAMASRTSSAVWSRHASDEPTISPLASPESVVVPSTISPV